MKYQTDFPEHCSTRYSLRVRFVETDLMGIVHHAAYLAYVEAARVEYLRRRGADYRALVNSGLHMPVVEARLAYKRAARFDDELDVEVRLGALSRVTVRSTTACSSPMRTARSWQKDSRFWRAWTRPTSRGDCPTISSPCCSVRSRFDQILLRPRAVQAIPASSALRSQSPRARSRS